MKILLINSDSVDLKSQAIFFNKKGCDILFTNDISQGYEIALKKTPALIVVSLYNSTDLPKVIKYKELNCLLIINNKSNSKISVDSDNSILLIENNTLTDEDLYNRCIDFFGTKTNQLTNIEKEVKKNVLLVEDNPLNQLYFGEILNRLNLNYTICDCMSEALLQIKLHRYHILITDVKLKDGNGIDLIKKTDSLAMHKIPSIIISGYSKEDLIETYGNINCDCFLTKPVNDRLFEETICECLNIKLTENNDGLFYNYNRIIEILKNDPIKINKSLIEFIDVLNNSIICTENVLNNNEHDELRVVQHELLNLCNYYGASKLSDMVLKFKSEKNSQLKNTILIELHQEQKKVFKFYSKLKK